MASLILLLIYSAMILLEAILLHRMLGVELKMDFVTVLMDTIVVNVISLVLIIVIFGRGLARLDTMGTQIYYFRTMLITWPQEILKICLFSIFADAAALAVWYRYRFPKLGWYETAIKGAMMNIPAFLLAGVSWAFVAILYEFFRFLRIV